MNLAFVKILCIVVVPVFLVGCKDPKQSTTAEALTKSLFESISSKQLGDPAIDIKYVPGKGISVHPGPKPTIVNFDVSKFTNKSPSLKAAILPLPAEAQAEFGAGTVGVEVIIDGRSLGRKPVDSKNSVVERLNLQGAKSIAVRIDNANNSPRWDWCILSVE